MTNVKDWNGNKKTTFVTLGASNHSEHERQKHDYYATDPNALKLFLNAIERDNVLLFDNIYEPACGEGHLSKMLIADGYNVHSSDLIDRGYGRSGIDFLTLTELPFDECDILTNPPYKFAKEFVKHSLELLKEGFYCVMFLKIQFLEGKERRTLFDKYPPKYVYVHSMRQTCYLNGDMSQKMSSATCYCWFIWEKGFDGEPVIRWI